MMTFPREFIVSFTTTYW